MINVIYAVIFGIIEGITEWLPISSTAHMYLFNQLVNFNVTESFYGIFEVVIQFGAGLALFILFFDKIWPFGKSANPLGKLTFVKKDTFMLLLKLALACVPVIVYKVVIEDLLHLEFNETLCIGISLAVVGLIFIIVELCLKKEPKYQTTREITFMSAFLIGIFQLVAAMFPGVSRSGATIVGALILGISRSAAVDFTYELAIPVMFGASLYEFIDYGFNFTSTEVILLVVGFLVAFFVSLFCINPLLDYLRKHKLTGFGIYRIALGALILALFFFKVI